MNVLALDWLRCAYPLSQEAVRRATVIRRGCRLAHNVTVASLGEEQKERAKLIATLNAAIDSHAAELRGIEEKAAGNIGAKALLGADIPAPILITTALLASARLHCSIKGCIGSELEVCEMAAGIDLEALLMVQAAFDASGVLRPHVTFSRGQHGAPVLIDSAFCKIVQSRTKQRRVTYV